MRLLLLSLLLTGCGANVINHRSYDSADSRSGNNGDANPNTINGGLLLQDLALTAPDGWKVTQRVKDSDTIILRFVNGEANFSIYVRRPKGLSLQNIFTGSAVKQSYSASFNEVDWTCVTTKTEFKAQNKTFFVSGFHGEKNGYEYFGFSRSENQEEAEGNTEAFLKLAKFAN